MDPLELQIAFVNAVLSTLTFLLSIWIAWSLHRHRNYDRGISLKERLMHPTKSPDEIHRRRRM